jgi:hypothetical protein
MYWFVLREGGGRVSMALWSTNSENITSIVSRHRELTADEEVLAKKVNIFEVAMTL